jgi:hypothetical protein
MLGNLWGFVLICRLLGSGSQARLRGILAEYSIGIRGVGLSAASPRTLFQENREGELRPATRPPGGFPAHALIQSER